MIKWDRYLQVDYMIWPWCERADMLGFLIGDRYKLDDERFPNLVSIKIVKYD